RHRPGPPPARRPSTAHVRRKLGSRQVHSSPSCHVAKPSLASLIARFRLPTGVTGAGWGNLVAMRVFPKVNGLMSKRATQISILALIAGLFFCPAAFGAGPPGATAKLDPAATKAAP